MSNEIINYEDKRIIETIKQTVARDATPDEFAMFVQFCKSTGLNPFKKEIWFIKTNSGVQMMTGIQGFWAIANSHPQFDGQKEDIETDEHGNPLKAVCKIYRKDRKFPSVGVALMKEYAKGSPIWRQMPSVMLMKCAESVAIRKAFPQELNGLYTAEEMPSEFNEPKPVPPSQPVDVNAETQILQRPVMYSIPNISRDQQLYIEKRGGEWNEEHGLWVVPQDLGPKLEKFKVLLEEAA